MFNFRIEKYAFLLIGTITYFIVIALRVGELSLVLSSAEDSVPVARELVVTVPQWGFGLIEVLSVVSFCVFAGLAYNEKTFMPPNLVGTVLIWSSMLFRDVLATSGYLYLVIGLVLTINSCIFLLAFGHLVSKPNDSKI